jgi:hypothetical protein
MASDWRKTGENCKETGFAKSRISNVSFFSRRDIFSGKLESFFCAMTGWINKKKV